MRRFQAIQTGPAALRIRLEVMPGADEMEIWRLVESRLQQYLSTHGLPSVFLEKDAEPPRPHPISGKFRHIWAELSPSGQ